MQAEEDAHGYYSVLGIEPTHDRAVIWRGFKEQGTKYLPEKDSEGLSKNSILFARIWEAYEVLSDPELKPVYDNYGEKILKNGLPTGTGHPGYAFNGDCYDSFIAALKRPIFEDREEAKRVPSKPKPEVEDLVVPVKWTLRELYNGWMKTISYKKEKLLHYSGRKTDTIHWEKLIEIRKGYSNNQEIRFVGEGHDAVGRTTGDLVVKVIEVPTEDFKSFGNHLIYTKRLTFEESLMPESIQIVTLDDRIINVSINETISQETATVVKGEGMPILDWSDPLVSLKNENKRGDLIIKYDLEFPKFLTADQKRKLKAIMTK